MDLDNITRGPEDYAIDSLASSLMGTTNEAMTETFYTGKHIFMNDIKFYWPLK